MHIFLSKVRFVFKKVFKHYLLKLLNYIYKEHLFNLIKMQN